MPQSAESGSFREEVLANRKSAAPEAPEAPLLSIPSGREVTPQDAPGAAVDEGRTAFLGSICAFRAAAISAQADCACAKSFTSDSRSTRRRHWSIASYEVQQFAA
jgi:hypothetical protein